MFSQQKKCITYSEPHPVTRLRRLAHTAINTCRNVRVGPKFFARFARVVLGPKFFLAADLHSEGAQNFPRRRFI